MRAIIAIALAAILGWLAGPLVGEVAMTRILERQAVTDGWVVNHHLGRYEGRWLLRSIVARVGLGALVPEEALYYRTSVDVNGDPLTGERSYAMRFVTGDDATGWPPANAFWSVTAYETETLQLVEHAGSTYQLGDRTWPWYCFDQTAPEIVLFNASVAGIGPEGQFVLPIPEERFDVVLRAYEPSEEMLSGAWMPADLVPAQNRETMAIRTGAIARRDSRDPRVCRLGSIPQ